MGKGYCRHGCYPVDKNWHGGGLRVPRSEIADLPGVSGPEDLKKKLGKRVYNGKGDFVIEDIVDFRRYVDVAGPAAAEDLLRQRRPHGEPYVRGRVDDDREPIKEKITKREISMSGIGQGFDMGAYLDTVDRLATHYKYGTVIKVGDWIRASPQSQVHQELTQRRQQAEQQINRTLGNLSDLYQQKQLLEHDLRKLKSRQKHVEKGGAEPGDTQDELKADFVDLVDQHTGRSSILQMQANNVFPSITADFYAMSGLEDLEEGGTLGDLPKNEKAVLRKKWKLYEQWKEQFGSAVESRLQDVQQRLNSVETSIEETEKWLQPYVQDIKQITGDFAEQLGVSLELGRYLPMGHANVYRVMKVIGAKDQTPLDDSDKWYDVVIMSPINFSTGGFENPQAAGQGLTVFNISWEEFLCCKHVYELVFQAQIDEKQNEVQEYIERYTGRQGATPTVDEKRAEIHSSLSLSSSEEEAVNEAESVEELEKLKTEFWEKRKPSTWDRWRNKILAAFGFTDEFYYPEPVALRQNLMGPWFPTGFYLDYKYGNDLYVMK